MRGCKCASCTGDSGPAVRRGLAISFTMYNCWIVQYTDTDTVEPVKTKRYFTPHNIYVMLCYVMLCYNNPLLSHFMEPCMVSMKYTIKSNEITSLSCYNIVFPHIFNSVKTNKAALEVGSHPTDKSHLSADTIYSFSSLQLSRSTKP